MKRILAIALMFAVAVSYGSLLSAQAVGVITGTVYGPSGPLAGVTVNVYNAAGTLVSTARTTSTGFFSASGLPTGAFAVQAVSPNGTVLATSPATLSTGAMTATVRMTATRAAMSGSGTAAASSGFRTGAIVAGVGAAAAAVGVVAVIATGDDASPSQ